MFGKLRRFNIKHINTFDETTAKYKFHVVYSFFIDKIEKVH